MFGARAEQYVTSPAHADPELLARVVRLAAPQPGWRALDVGTGTGHMALALAPHVREVVGLDLTPQMLERAERARAERGAENVSFTLGDAHDLPFPDGAFQLVLCRRTAHHFSNVARALAEMRRVLARGGRLVIDDRTVPEDDFVDAVMDTLDRLHDPSHVRQWRVSEWRRLLAAAGFGVQDVATYEQSRPLGSLTDGVPAERARLIEALLRGLSSAEREKLGLRDGAGEARITHWYVTLTARR